MSKQLTSEQRYAIYLGLARKQSKKSIAQEIGVHPSTITREVQRNSNRDNQYVFAVAQRKCESRKHSTLGNHRKDDTLWWRVEQMIKDEDWSPRQISGIIGKTKGALFAKRKVHKKFNYIATEADIKSVSAFVTYTCLLSMFFRVQTLFRH